MTNSAEQAVLEVLRNGGSLRYFFLHGGVAVHGADGAPLRDITCPMEVFFDLRKREVVEMTEREKSGYPYYANNHKSSVYRLKRG